MMKKSLFSTKTIVATSLGAALFLVLFMFVKIPSPVPETNIQIAYGISAFFGALFGPICGGLIAFVGHALNDLVAYGSAWWSWIIASGVAGIFAGFAYFKLDLEKGQKPGASFFVWNLVGHAVAWLLVAPVLDIVMYGEPVNLVFVQGVTAFLINGITAAIVGGILAVAYASTRTTKGSLDKE
ncbi:MAG: ECF-type riboflavin transporter substrate-binding protein [Erysipelotrichaceae bacterium]|nr:ECF-type riboflavin transporter substrate-binding protein [Erysipelotrichaceae bacterium]